MGQTQTHSHSIYVFDARVPDRIYWMSHIYAKIRQHILDGYAVIYVMEQDVTAAVQHMTKISGFEVEDYIGSGALTIISNKDFYSHSVREEVLLDQWYKLISYVERKSGKFRGFVAIGMPVDSFFRSAISQEHLIRYEATVASRYDGTVEAVCCYTTEAIEKMPLRYIMGLLNAHQNTAHRESVMKEWTVSRGVSIIRRGLDSALGSQVSELVFAMLMRDFEMKPAAIVSHPDQFENKLRILYGEHAADIIIAKIKEELISEIVF